MIIKKFNVKGLIIIGICIITLSLIIFIAKHKPQVIQRSDEVSIQKNETSEVNNIEVTAEDLQEFRNNIGNDMDIKKSILIIFNSAEECQAFIDEYGDDENVLSLGKGIIPQMQGENGEQYYNAVGNFVFEQLFDNMQNGEYLKEPTEFGGAYCYFKRLTIYSVLDNDEKLTEFIKQEKSMEKDGEAE